MRINAGIPSVELMSAVSGCSHPESTGGGMGLGGPGRGCALDDQSRPEGLDAAPLPKGGCDARWWPATSVVGEELSLRICVSSSRHARCPVRPLLWVSKSHDKLAVALQKMGHRSAPTACADCCRRSATAGNRTARPTRARSIRIGTTNSSTSIPKWLRRRLRASPSSPSTQRRKMIGNYRNGGTDYRAKAIRGA